jgi:hypothetical protein
MYARNAQFYDVVGKGLAALGYTGANALETYINDMFADKYNADATFAQMGFPLNPDIPLHPTYEQIEATIRPYSMAAYVDIDSDGPAKSTDGLSLKSGELPVFKHETGLNRKMLREKLLLMDSIGGSTPEIEEFVMQLLFNGLDDLIGGNYNTIQYQRHQIVSTGKLVIDATNNPYGLPLEIDWGVPTANKTDSTWYAVAGDGTVTQATAVTNGTISPIDVMRKIRTNAELNDFAPAGHWECALETYNALVAMPYFRSMYVTSHYPGLTDAQNTKYAAAVDEDVVWQYIQSRVGRIEVIDATAAVEKIDPATKKAAYTNLRSFKSGVLVYVPNGAIGDVQCGKPIFMETPGARTALYDGGRTLIRQVFNDENMNQTIKSEVQALCVPNKVRWMYYLTVDGSND